MSNPTNLPLLRHGECAMINPFEKPSTVELSQIRQEFPGTYEVPEGSGQRFAVVMAGSIDDMNFLSSQSKQKLGQPFLRLHDQHFESKGTAAPKKVRPIGVIRVENGQPVGTVTLPQDDGARAELAAIKEANAALVAQLATANGQIDELTKQLEEATAPKSEGSPAPKSNRSRSVSGE